MKYLSKAFGPALAVAAILSLSACVMPQNGMQGCCASLHCCSGKMSCCKSMHGCCCCGGGNAKGCPYAPKAKHD